MEDISFDGAPHQFFKLLEELIEITVCGIVFLHTISFLYDPRTLQDNWQQPKKILKFLLVLSFRFSVVIFII